MRGRTALALLATALGAGCTPWYVRQGLTVDAVHDPRMAPRMAEIVAGRGPGRDEAALLVAAECDAATMNRLLPDIVRALGESDDSPCRAERPSDWQVNARCDRLLQCTATLGEPAARTLTAVLRATTGGRSIDDGTQYVTRWLVVVLLGSLGHAAAGSAPELLDILEHDRASLRRTATHALAATGTSWPPAVAALDRAARSDGDGLVRRLAPREGGTSSHDDDDQRAALDQRRLFVERWRLADTIATLQRQQRSDTKVLLAGAGVGVPGTAAFATSLGLLLGVVRGEGVDAYGALLGTCFGPMFVATGLVLTAVGAILHGQHSARLRRLRRAQDGGGP